MWTLEIVQMCVDVSKTISLSAQIINLRTPESAPSTQNLTRAENGFYYNFLGLRGLSRIVTTL